LRVARRPAAGLSAPPPVTRAVPRVDGGTVVGR